jgi:hypothetical protein
MWSEFVAFIRQRQGAEVGDLSPNNSPNCISDLQVF